jgi:hypothetical protein
MDQGRVDLLETCTMSIMVPPDDECVSCSDNLDAILGKIEATTILLTFIS